MRLVCTCRADGTTASHLQPAPSRGTCSAASSSRNRYAFTVCDATRDSRPVWAWQLSVPSPTLGRGAGWRWWVLAAGDEEGKSAHPCRPSTPTGRGRRGPEQGGEHALAPAFPRTASIALGGSIFNNTPPSLDRSRPQPRLVVDVHHADSRRRCGWLVPGPSLPASVFLHAPCNMM